MKKQGGVYFLKKSMIILLIINIGLFLFPVYLSQAVTPGDIVINEIKIGETGESKNEFVELYNNTSADIDLSGYKLKKKTQTGTESNLVSSAKFVGVIPAMGFFVISHPDYLSANNAHLAYSGASYSISSNNTVLLYDADDTLIDKVGYGEAGDFENAACINPENGESINRVPLGHDSDNNSADFILSTTPTPGQDMGSDLPPITPECGNGELEQGEECDDGDLINGDGCDENCNIETTDPGSGTSTTTPPDEEDDPSTSSGQEQTEQQFIKLGGIVINELVSDPADDDVEWVELYNTLNIDVYLDGWTIIEGSEKETLLEGELGTDGSQRFLVIEKPKGSLNNKGDIVILRDSKGVLIDQVSYGNWDDGSEENNAPQASDPNSIARKIDGYNSFNNAQDFAFTTSPTKGRTNIIVNTEDGSANESYAKKTINQNTDIIISEIFPNPVGDDNDGEFIELYNQSDKDIDLTGWQLGDESSKKYEIKNSEENLPIIISASSYYVIYRTVSKIAQNNNADSIKLYQPNGDMPNQVIEYIKAEEGQSYNLVISELDTELQYVWSSNPSPGKENIFPKINHAPIAEFNCPDVALIRTPVIFDSSDTTDSDGDTLSFSWDFGDKATNTLQMPEHTYFETGVFNIVLSVSDSNSTTTKEKIISIVNNLDDISSNTEEIYFVSETEEDSFIPGIIINEFLPDPEGSDMTGEWIEIYNRGDTRISMASWQLDDMEGGSKPYSFTEEFILSAGAYLLLHREESGLALNNNTDVVRLFNEEGEIVDEVNYSDPAEGEAYARGLNNKWFWTTMHTPGEENIITVSNSNILDTDNYSISSVQYMEQQKDSEGFSNVDLEKIQEIDIGEKIKTKGTIAVLPGILGTQYFYIVGSQGVQVYNYKKEFPDMKVGDYIEVQGELGAINGEARIKTKLAEDIKVIEHKDSPQAEEATCEGITEEMCGRLVEVTGEVVDIKGSSIYLDDGSDEILVYIKNTTGINTKQIKEGENLRVTGLISRTKSGVRIMPRSSDDIVKKDIESTDAGQVLGEIEVSDEWMLEERNKKLELFQYLLVIAGGVIILLVGLLVKLKQDKQ